MSKTHFINRRRQSPRSQPDKLSWVWAVCGIGDFVDSMGIIGKWSITEDEDEVTCKNCLRVMAKREKESNGTDNDTNQSDARGD